MRFRNPKLMAALAATALLLVACGEAASNVQSDTALSAPVRPAVIGEGSLGGFAAETEAAVMQTQDAEVVVAARAAATSRPAPTSAPPPAAAAPLFVQVERESRSRVVEPAADETVVDRKIIRTASLAIVVPDLDGAVRRVRDLIASLPGAFIAASNLQEDDPMRVSTITLRIPAAQFEQAMRELRAIASRIVDEDIQSQDVTAQFTDLAAQLRNAQATERQFLEILERARTVEDTIDVQRELSAVRERIELLQGRLNLLRNQTDLATIRLLLHPAPDLSLKRELPAGAAMHQQVTLGTIVHNEGTVEVEEIEVRESLDPGMIFVAASGDGAYDPAAHAVTWTLERMGPEERRSLHTTVRLEGDGREMTSVARLSTATGEQNPSNNTATGRLSFHVDLGIEKDGAVAVPLGRDAEYTLAFRNRGSGDATDVRIEEALPEGMQFVRAGGGGRYDAGQHTVVWVFARLQPDAYERVSYVARVERSEGRLQTETKISAAQTDRADVDNTATTFLTALPEDLEQRDVWTPGNTVREGVDALTGIGRWAVDAGIKVGIVGVPLAAIAVLLGLPLRAYWRRRRATGSAEPPTSSSQE